MITSAHLAFQTVLKWLWDRHDEVCEKTHTASCRPEWVPRPWHRAPVASRGTVKRNAVSFLSRGAWPQRTG